MQTTITGKIEEIQELKHKGPNKDFKVQNVIVEVDNSYKKNGETIHRTQPLKVEFKQKNTELLKGFNKGDNVSIDWNLAGSKWQNANMQEPMYFVSIEAWKIAHHIEDEMETTQQAAFHAAPELDGHKENIEAQFPGKDDLPF